MYSYPLLNGLLGANHRFIPEQPDWGFNNFSELPKLFHAQPGQNRPIIEEDSMVVSVYVRVLEDPTGVLWHDFVNYDSKKQTGYVALKIQDTTGYMNALLQSLFCINFFRKAIYKIPTKGQRPTKSVSLALQRAFYKLQTSNQAIDTTELQESFARDSLDPLVHHDIQEFNKVLLDKLKSLMKGTSAEATIPNLFAGKMKSFIKCVNVDYESSGIGEFNTVELHVKGKKTLYDSFQDYVAVEMLDGVQTGKFGLQEARRGVIFQSFPPVLHLVLQRCEYDIQHDSVVKIHDRFEFPFEIDLGTFLDETADRSKPWKYHLHSVLVQSGDLDHYFALIKPDKNSRWLKFDDDRVTPVMDSEVLDQTRATTKSTNARMLVFIRETAMDDVLAPITMVDVSPHLKKMKRKKGEKEWFLTVKIIMDDTFSRHKTFDLADDDSLPTFQVARQETYRVFKSRVAQHLNYTEKQIKLWVLSLRRNNTLRPDKYIRENKPSLTLEKIHSDIAARRRDLLLYLDILPDPSMKILLENAGTIMVFLKHFDSTKQTLFGAGKVYVPSARKVRELTLIINDRMGWAFGTPLKLYEEVKPGMVELIKPDFTFAQSEIQDGDIICFQIDIPDGEARDLEFQGLHSNPPQFYNSLWNLVLG